MDASLSLQDLGAIGEFFGAGLLFATLLFLGIQVRANRQSTQLAMFESLVGAFNATNRVIAEDVAVARVFRIGLGNPDALTEDEATQFMYLVSQYMNTLYAIWTLHQSGNAQQHFSNWARQATIQYFSSPGIARGFEAQKSIYVQEYIDYVESLPLETFNPDMGWRNLTPSLRTSN